MSSFTRIHYTSTDSSDRLIVVAIFALCVGHAGFAFKKRDAEVDFVQEPSSDGENISGVKQSKAVDEKCQA